jgi:uncharacterized protein YqeY
MLIEKLRGDMIAARKGDDAVAKSLMVTLYSEAAMVGKNKRNGDTTDEEAIAVIKKFAANAEETRRLLDERGQDTSVQAREIRILEGYLPSQLDRAGLDAVIRMIIHDMKLEGPKAMGSVMAELKRGYSGRYDGKMASDLTKVALASNA